MICGNLRFLRSSVFLGNRIVHTNRLSIQSIQLVIIHHACYPLNRYKTTYITILKLRYYSI